MCYLDECYDNYLMNARPVLILSVGAAIHLRSKQNSYVEFDLSPPLTTSRDQLAFGLQSTKRGSSVLLFLRGHEKSTDYIEISIVRSKVCFLQNAKLPLQMKCKIYQGVS